MSKPGRNRGEKNFRNKLTQQQVLAIFNEIKLTQQELADRFHVSQSAINHIRKGRTWSWLTSKRK